MVHVYYMCHREILEILGEGGSLTGASGSVGGGDGLCDVRCWISGSSWLGTVNMLATPCMSSSPLRDHVEVERNREWSLCHL